MKKLPEMMDLVAQRILSVQIAARDGGKTDAAQLRELLPSDTGLLQPSGMALMAA
jgi:hypothetical protein